MANSALQCLVGEAVTDAVRVHDYVQLAFGTVAGLSIYNDFEVMPEHSRIEELVGLTIAAVTSNEDEAVMLFERGLSLRVNLRASAFHGPEAMQLNRPGHSTFVWN